MHTTSIPLSLYVHLPWCVRKCPYCDFNSHALTQPLPVTEYVNRLIEDIHFEATRVKNRSVVSIFFGGGTPSLFPAEAIGKIIDTIRHTFITYDDLEITLEANPGTVEIEKFKAFRKVGVNRLSIGIQSFDDQQLMTLGRIHDAEAGRKAIKTALAAGFTAINVDIMHGLPNQSVEESLEDLNIALSFPIDHLSWYQLTLEPNTLFHNNPPELPCEETLWAIETSGKALLADHGFQAYEVSAFSKPGHMCKHNLNYWTFGDYIGVGAGAHGKITLNSTSIIRTNKRRHPRDYLDPRHSVEGMIKPIPQQALPFEFMLNALRLERPISLDLFESRTFCDRSLIIPLLEQARTKGWILDEPQSIALTDLGKRFRNDVMQLFLTG